MYLDILLYLDVWQNECKKKVKAICNSKWRKYFVYIKMEKIMPVQDTQLVFYVKFHMPYVNDAFLVKVFSYQLIIDTKIIPSSSQKKSIILTMDLNDTLFEMEEVSI